MSHKLPFSFEEFDRRDSKKGASSEKRGRDETSDDRRPHHHHTIRVYCTCCDKEIDLRTVHCGDCCDDSSRRQRMSHKLPFSFEEFDRRDSKKGASSEKRGRDETSDDRRPHHTIRVYCTCCDKEIDLRTVHCGDCCDDNAARTQGSRSSGHNHRRDKNRRGGSAVGSKPQHDTKHSSTPKDASSSSHSKHTHGSQSSLTFVPEGYRHHSESNAIRPLGAEEALAPSRALEESEADLIDLSIAPAIGE
ncbi:Hypothetical protein, putative [Bodo saltans]|uniref:Uncharacterized protein n=1 Tax=Bodo saltans TaxID=75058 RepID=A0A0S4J2F3_BODSA|nr:Hypothetical protein, putative [Bodo saltans]|eukprot:CUG83914.1 Hypothetical protein, putative [Bodo saltans]